MNPRSSFGEFLSKARDKMGFTQKELAQKVGFESGGAQFISNWERGISMPPIERARKVCQLLGIPGEAWVREWERVLKAEMQRDMKLVKRSVGITERA